MPDSTPFKVAFTSCMSTTAFPDAQPVWDQIAAHAPDVLVLLGDSVYIDCPPVPDNAGCPHPREAGYTDQSFAMHLLDLYQRQWAVPGFAATVQGTRTHAIWDDHDFLWDNANGQYQYSHAHVGRMVISANLLACWREALQGHQALPTDTRDPRLWTHWSNTGANNRYDLAAPGYRCEPWLDGRIWLHLTDGRSWRSAKSKQLLGPVQWQQMADAMAAAPDALHLVASGSTFAPAHPLCESWSAYPTDRDALLDLASRYNLLMLSGNVHGLRLPDPIGCGAKFFHEATASGAAVNFAPWDVHTQDTLGQFTQRFGVLEIQTGASLGVTIRLFDHGAQVTSRALPWPF
jgi:alkaline phosphatase D